MLTTAIIAFREFLEAFLITGMFWGLSRSLKLGREKEIVGAALTGFVGSFILVIGTYILGDHARSVLTEDNADLLENYLQIFSGCFLVYVIFSLHKVLHAHQQSVVKNVASKLKDNAFDFSLFAIIVFLVMREGFEIALFTASTSLFSVFFQNLLGLMIGFAAAGIIGFGTSLAYIKFPLKRVFQVTEYLIMLLGAALFQSGLTALLDKYANIHLSHILSLHTAFLPGEDSLVGHALQTFTGIDRQFSIGRLAIMVGYIGLVYMLFIKKSPFEAVSNDEK